MFKITTQKETNLTTNEQFRKRTWARISLCGNQCSGSAPGSGSVVPYLCFWAFWFRILPSTSKKMKKIFDFYWFVTFCDFISSKNDVNVPSKRNKCKNLVKTIIFGWHLEGRWRKEQDPDSDRDPLVKDTDPRIRIRIRTKISRIRNTGGYMKKKRKLSDRSRWLV